MPKPDGAVEEPVVEPEDPKTPLEQPVETPETPPGEVLPPEEGSPEEDPSTPQGEPVGDEEPAAEPEPTAAELKAQLEAANAKIATLEGGDEPADEEPAVPVKPTGRVSMSQTYLTQAVPEHRKEFAAAKTPGEQYNVVMESANQMVGSILHDSGIMENGKLLEVGKHLRGLAISNVHMANELEIRDLRSDPEFKRLEPEVRKQLAKTAWSLRAGDDKHLTPVADIYHRLIGAKKNGAIKPQVPSRAAAPAAGKILRDVAAGGGASPKPTSVRLTTEQESDYKEMVENGWTGSRTEYYAKFQSRVQQAKAAKKPLPKTFRG